MVDTGKLLELVGRKLIIELKTGGDDCLKVAFDRINLPMNSCISN